MLMNPRLAKCAHVSKFTTQRLMWCKLLLMLLLFFPIYIRLLCGAVCFHSANLVTFQNRLHTEILRWALFHCHSVRTMDFVDYCVHKQFSNINTYNTSIWCCVGLCVCIAAKIIDWSRLWRRVQEINMLNQTTTVPCEHVANEPSTHIHVLSHHSRRMRKHAQCGKRPK